MDKSKNPGCFGHWGVNSEVCTKFCIWEKECKEAQEAELKEIEKRIKE